MSQHRVRKLCRANNGEEGLRYAQLRRMLISIDTIVELIGWLKVENIQ